MLTEQRNPRSMHIDRMSTEDMLRVMNAEDATVAGVVADAIPEIARAVETIAAALDGGGRLFYVGAGTSGRLGVLDASECPPTFGTPPETVQAIIAGGDMAIAGAVEGAEDDSAAGRAALQARGLTANDVVVGIAASGRTPFALGAVTYAKEQGAPTIGIACNVPSPLLDAVMIPIGLAVGPEVVTGSTRLKAGTAQKLVLNMLSTASMIRVGKVYENLMVDVRVTNDKLAARARRIVATVLDIQEDAAAALLVTTNNNVKEAIVVGALDVGLDEARTMIAAKKGRLNAILDSNE